MQAFDVIIIGRGITGLSTGLHLKRYGIGSFCFVAPSRDFTNCASINSGYAAVSTLDNISRTVHGHGEDAARNLLRLGRIGFSDLMDLTTQFKVDHHEGRVYRLTQSDMEAQEMAVASSWLASNGFPSSVSLDGRGTQKLTYQSDGTASASINMESLLGHMEEDLSSKIFPEDVIRIETTPRHISVLTSSGIKLTAEVVVVASHLGIKKLIPNMESCLVNHADQWAEFEFDGRYPFLTPGNLLLSDFSQYWISVTSDRKLRAGGARYLRKWAGVEAIEAHLDEKITSTVKKRIESLFDVKLSNPTLQHALLELRACDEIPIIGPMYDDSRVLMAGGYMGSGLTLGCAAGRGLSEFIIEGRSKTVPAIFHPKRLRSLAE
jgi:glycine/D-amino acid oxidase-like deaminating enzyme